MSKLLLSLLLVGPWLGTQVRAEEPSLGEILAAGPWDHEYIASQGRSIRGKWHFVFGKGGAFTVSKSDDTVDKFGRKQVVKSEYKGKWNVKARKLTRKELNVFGDVMAPKRASVLTVQLEGNKKQFGYEDTDLNPNGVFVAALDGTASEKARLVFVTLKSTALPFANHDTSFPERPLILIAP